MKSFYRLFTGGFAETLGEFLHFLAFGPALVKGVVARGTTLHINVVGSPTTWQKIGNITDFNGPGNGSADVIDASNLDSVAKEKLMGLFDEGQLSFNINLDPDDAVHQAVRLARRNKTLCEFKLTLTDTTATIGYFFGYVLQFGHTGAINSLLKVGVQVEIDGEVNWQ